MTDICKMNEEMHLGHKDCQTREATATDDADKVLGKTTIIILQRKALQTAKISTLKWKKGGGEFPLWLGGNEPN